MLTYTKNVFIPLQVEGGFEFHFCCWTTTKKKHLFAQYGVIYVTQQDLPEDSPHPPRYHIVV